MLQGFANIYTDDGGSTFTPVSSAFTAWPGSTIFIGFSNDHRYILARPTDSTALGFTIGWKGRGMWRVGWTSGFTGDVGSQSYHIAMFRNGTKIPNTSMERKLGTAGDIGAASGEGLVALHNNDSVDFYIQVPTTATTATINHLSITLEMLSTSTVVG